MEIFRQPSVQLPKLGSGTDTGFYFLIINVGSSKMQVTISSVSYTHLRTHETMRTISYAVFCLKKFFFNDTATTEIYTIGGSSAASDVYKRQVRTAFPPSFRFRKRVLFYVYILSSFYLYCKYQKSTPHMAVKGALGKFSYSG